MEIGAISGHDRPGGQWPKYGKEKGGKGGKDKSGKGDKSGKDKKGAKNGTLKGAVKFTGTCNWCQKVGHKEAECRKKAADQKNGNNLNVVEQEDQNQVGEEKKVLGSIWLCPIMRSLDILALELKGSRTVEVGIDSCAGISVWPAAWDTDYPLLETPDSRQGTEYFPAGSGTTIRDLG